MARVYQKDAWSSGIRLTVHATPMKKPLIQNIKIATKVESACYISGLSLRLSNLFGWWDGGMAKTSVNQNSSEGNSGR